MSKSFACRALGVIGTLASAVPAAHGSTPVLVEPRSMVGQWIVRDLDGSHRCPVYLWVTTESNIGKIRSSPACIASLGIRDVSGRHVLRLTGWSTAPFRVLYSPEQVSVQVLAGSDPQNPNVIRIAPLIGKGRIFMVRRSEQETRMIRAALNREKNVLEKGRRFLGRLRAACVAARARGKDTAGIDGMTYGCNPV